MNVLTTNGYFERFYWHLQNGCHTHIQAYRKVEDERMERNCPAKYVDYFSFKRGKSYHLKKKGRFN